MRPFFAALLLLLPYLSFTQSVKQQKDTVVTNLDSIIVFGRADLRQITQIAPYLLKGTHADLIDALDHIPGIFKVHETGYPLVYRGMSGNRLRIERNGVLRTGVVDQGYLVDDFNPENVRSINIVQGAERVLYGSGAIGGVIQINEFDASFRRKNRVYSAYSTNNRGKSLGLSYNKQFGQFGILFSGRSIDTGNFRYANKTEANNSARDQINLTLSTMLQNPTNGFLASWNHNLNSGLLERPQGFQNNPYELRSFKNRFTYQTDFGFKNKFKKGIILEQRLWGLFIETDQERKNYNSSYESVNVFENRTYIKSSFGYRGKAHTPLKEGLKLTTGADFVGSWLKEQTVVEDFLNPNFNDNDTAFRNEQMIGLFGMFTFQQPSFIYKAALRQDFASIGNQDESLNFNAITGGIEVNWLTSDQMKNTFSLNRQFRYPTKEEALGVFYGGRGAFYGNPNIEPEFSHQLEWQMAGYLGTWEYGFESWLAILSNRISEVFLGDGEYTYENTALARTWGWEAYLSYEWGNILGNDKLRTSLNGSFIQGDELTQGWLSNGTPLVGIPPARVRFVGQYKKQYTDNVSFDIHFNLDRVARLNRLPEGPIRQTWGVLEAKAYWLLQLKIEAQWQWKNHILNSGVSIANLTNTEYFPFGTRVMGMGRNFNLFLGLSF